MKRTIAILCGMLVLLWSAMAMGAPPMQREAGLSKVVSTADIDYQTYIDANRLLMFVTNQGSFAYDNGSMFGKADGLYYPRGTNLSVIYAGGLWLGAKVGGDLRVSLAEYSHTYWPGPVVGGTFIEDADSDPQYRVYKIIKDRLNSGFYDEPRPDGDPELERIWDDYHEWPADLGAPVDDDGNPEITGDQTLWSIYNDFDPSVHTNSSGSAEGLGVEVQQTVFAFNRTGALGECAFIKFKFINMSDDDLIDMYASVWADPDLGDAGDDLVGSDADLSMGYCYNATNNDANYGKTPPAAGYDFFQGPMVPSPGDVAVFNDGRVVEDYKILGMTSFNKYINGTDPDNAEETYWYQQGLDAKNSGAPIVDPTTGEVTTYQFPGDPTTGTGWLDENESDRRYMCSTGPFDMAPDDTQEVVVAVVVGQGSDRLTSITAMKFNDLFAQSAFDANFILPDPPARPVVTAVPMDDQIALHWGTESEDNPGDYEFQGYNVYQGESVAGPWKRIATFDLNDGTGIIFDLEFVIEEGAVIDHPVQFGSDTGIRRYFELNQDYIRGGGLNNAFEYYWAVTAYSYDPEKTPKTLENAPEAIIATPQKSAGGFLYPLGYDDTLDVVHETGDSDGIIEPIVVDQRDLTGHDYRITFTDAGGGQIFWHLFDVTANEFVLQDQTNQSGDEDYPIVDGLLMKVAGPPEDINPDAVVEVAGPGGVPVDPPDHVFWSWNSTEEYYVSSDDGSNHLRLNWRGHIGIDDWEFRFTSEGSQYYDWNEEVLFADRVPFEVWNIGSATPDDASDDVRIQITILDDDESGGYSVGDRIYLSEQEYYEPLPEVMDYIWDDDFKLGRIVFNGDPPQEGTVIRFVTNKINLPNDVFTFTAPATVDSSLAGDADYDINDIKVVPNPYFNQSLYEPDQFNRMIKFTNLPYDCEIKVFTLAGDHVVTLEKEPSASSILVWNMLTENNLPLASGVYLYIVTAADGQEFVGKMAIFTEVEQLNTY